MNISSQTEKRQQVQNKKIRIAFFISPHGFGHAARAASVMEALLDISPSFEFEIFTSVPEWFFTQSLSTHFTYHDVLTDIGLVQKTPLHEDLKQTVLCLNQFLPFDQGQITRLSKLVYRMKCQLIICDISPLGIAVARTAGIPSVLIENFTWDWIYQGYQHTHSSLGLHIHYLAEIFESADYHIQTEPVCLHRTADLTTFPVSRRARSSSRQIRKSLGIPADVKTVLITMGGIPEQYTFLGQLTQHRDIFFIIPGSSQRRQLTGNLILLPYHSNFYHPDLMNTGDAVVGKIGYSTLSETYYAGNSFGYVPRRRFRESEKLEIFIRKHMDSRSISAEQFQDGRWAETLQDLLTFSRKERTHVNGSAQIAHFISRILKTDFKE